jgi:hypothetical protein
VTILPGRPIRVRARLYPGRVTDAPNEPLADDTGHDTDDADEDDAEASVDVVDTNVDRFIDRMVQSSGGSISGNAMIGMAKGMGLYQEPEIAAEIREVGPPEPDDDDPIEVTIDPDHPENTRIVYRLQRSEAPDA